MNDEPDMRAAEYVLRTLDASERAAFERDLLGDPALRAAVVEWEGRLAPLALTAREVAPPAGMFARIETALASDQSVNAIVELRRALGRWRLAAVVAGALAASLALFVIDRALLTPPAQPGATFVAAVNRGGDLPALIVRVDLASGKVFVRPLAAETPVGKSLELWYIGDGAAPRSMGLVGQASERRSLPQGARLEKAKFAVTVEPEGGSPTGGPTGPIVYSGALVRE